MPKPFQGLLLICILLFSISGTRAQKRSGNEDYRQKMRDLVKDIAKKSRSKNSDFIIIPQNGIELIQKSGKNKTGTATPYLNAISAVAQEDLFYGYLEDDLPTPHQENSYLINYLNLIKQIKKPVFSIDYAFSDQNVTHSYFLNSNKDFIPFVAKRELNEIPQSKIFRENTRDIQKLEEVRNFLYLLNFSNFRSKEELIDKLAETNYDLLIIDAFFGRFDAFSAEEIASLKKKGNGGSRLVIAYMSIGEAEEYRFYWQKNWETYAPAWLTKENPNWAGNYKVKYWHTDWKNIIYRSENSYLRKIQNAGFDGVYLDIIDAFEYFENE
ncbi:endo alpha-1,4 polygalactosaminidase [Gramella lutea]|uniref:Endo alpha-1,4 polygalactosaminidase n=1 Tax=Christiangramia lutea TaxID=1607951 RepID=A0A9X1V2G5_9FLAO|nr:endo alpha-1,4 polygalactosaminidase [Christiangramia lutea]MCH4822904.1 endo alpha-1,4 polygalactosaminidase [Christiangramia lutea]